MDFVQDLVRAAKEGRLAHLPDIQEMLTNPDLRIPRASTQEALPLELAVLEHMLERYPVRPDEAARMSAAMDTGILRLEFFQLSNPVPVVYVLPSHPAVARLKQALARNLRSPQFRAATALFKWQSLPKVWARSRWESAVMAAHKKTRAWPTVEDFRRNADAARQCQHELSAQLPGIERAIRDRRQARLQKIRALAGLEVSWHQVQEQLAVHVLSAYFLEMLELA